MVKNKKLGVLAALSVVFGAACVSVPGASATNPYGITYSGGEALGSSNVQIDPDLVSNLTPLIGTKATTSVSNSSKWEKGYIKGDGQTCTAGSYFRVWEGNTSIANSGLSFSVVNGKYTAKADLKNVVFDGTSSTVTSSSAISIMVAQNGYFYVGFPIYSDSQCTKEVSNVKRLTRSDGIDVYLETQLKIYENATGDVFSAEGVFFDINDIDSGQSYKILNEGNELSSSNMYAKSAEALQSNDPTVTLKNMFVSSGNYIYSQYNSDGDQVLNLNAGSQVFVKLTPETQKNGVDVVFGFTYSAGSGLRVYAEQLQVLYTSDGNGSITGISDENVVAGDNPSGSSSAPNDGYQFDYWVVDKDVTLNDGTVIKAGEKMTANQVKNVVVTEKLVFTAIHTPIPASIGTPDTGEFAKNGNNSAFILGVSLPVIAVIVALGYYICDRKKHTVKFD